MPFVMTMVTQSLAQGKEPVISVNQSVLVIQGTQRTCCAGLVISLLLLYEKAQSRFFVGTSI